MSPVAALGASTGNQVGQTISRYLVCGAHNNAGRQITLATLPACEPNCQPARSAVGVCGVREDLVWPDKNPVRAACQASPAGYGCLRQGTTSGTSSESEMSWPQRQQADNQAQNQGESRSLCRPQARRGGASRRALVRYARLSPSRSEIKLDGRAEPKGLRIVRAAHGELGHQLIARICVIARRHRSTREASHQTRRGKLSGSALWTQPLAGNLPADPLVCRCRLVSQSNRANRERIVVSV